MTQPNRKPLQPLDDADINAAVSNLAAARDIPTLTQPTRATQGLYAALGDPEFGEEAQAGLAEKTGSSRSEPAADKAKAPRAPRWKQPRSAARAAQVPYTVLLPDYLAKALKIKAATDDVSIRYLVMKALKKDGHTIHEGDLVEDARGRKPNA